MKLINGIKVYIVPLEGFECVVFLVGKRILYTEGFIRLQEFITWSLFFTDSLVSLEEAINWSLIFEEEFHNNYFGYFIEGHTIKLFYKDYYKILSEIEKDVFNWFLENGYFDKKLKRLKKFCAIIINVPLCKEENGNINSTLKHEFSHLLYNNNSKYRRRVNGLFKNLNSVYKENIKKIFSSKKVYLNEDEWASRSIGENEYNNFHKHLTKKQIKSIKELRVFFRNHYKKFTQLLH